MMDVVLKRYIILVLIIFSLGIKAQEIRELLPSIEELPGWQINQEPQVYSGEELFELIDGGADIYLEYGFSKVVSVQYTDPSQNNILVEIYEMNNDWSAYGIFSLTQQMVIWTRSYGNLSAVSDDYISFWKGKYYVNLSWSSRQHIEEPLLAKVAGLIGDRIADQGEIPILITNFQADIPDVKLIYLKGNLALSNFYYFDYKDIFWLQQGVAWTSGTYHTIIIKYDNPDMAVTRLADSKSCISVNKRFSDVTNTFQGFSCKDNKGNLILVRQIENFIVILVGLDQTISLVPIMDDFSKKIESIYK